VANSRTLTLSRPSGTATKCELLPISIAAAFRVTWCSWGGRLEERTRRRGIGMAPSKYSNSARCGSGGGETGILLNGIAGASPLMGSQHLRDQTAGRAASTTVSMAFTLDSAAQAYHSWGCAKEVTSRWIAVQWHKVLLANSSEWGRATESSLKTISQWDNSSPGRLHCPDWWGQNG